MTLSEKEAFQMILNTIFKQEGSINTAIHTCMNSVNEDPVSEFDKVIEYIKPILVGFNERITALEENNTPKEVKITKTTPKRANGSSSRNKQKTNPNEEYVFSDSYKRELNWELKDDGTVGSVSRKQGGIEAYQLLKLFKQVDIPFTNKEYPAVKKTILNIGLTFQIGMTLLYHLKCELQRGYGDFIDILYEIYSNEYSVPAYLNFRVQNNQITINDVETGIKPFQVKQWLDELDISDKEGTMIKIMKENQDIHQTYLWYILQFSDRKELLEVL